MPYIDKNHRSRIDTALFLLDQELRNAPAGHFNYAISKLIWSQFARNPNYDSANTLIGVLEAVKLEFYRRKVAPYEDRKIAENGDIE